MLDDRSSLISELNICTISRVVANNSNDYIVRSGEEVVIRDQVFAPQGDIIVECGGRLVLRNAEVVFSHTGYYEHGIILRDNTILEAYNSQIHGTFNLFFFKAQNTTLIMEDTKIRMTHVLCGNSSRISIVRSDMWALHCFNESTVSVDNGRLHYLFLRGRSSALVDDSDIVEILMYDHSYASVSNTTLKNIFYFDEGWTALSNCSYVDLIRFEPQLCNLTIEVLDEEGGGPIPEATVDLNRSVGSWRVSSSTNDDGIATFHSLEEGDYIVGVEAEGYESFSIRVAVLDKVQSETFGISRLVEEGSRFSLDRYLLISIGIVSTFLVVYVLYRGRLR